MKKLIVIKWVDGLLFVLLIFIMSTGVLLAFSLPHHSGPASIWGFTRHDWGDFHFYLAVVFLIFLVTHLALHLNFLKKMLVGQATPTQRYRAIIGVVSFLLLIALAFAPFLSSVENERSWPNKGEGALRYEKLE